MRWRKGVVLLHWRMWVMQRIYLVQSMLVSPVTNIWKTLTLSLMMVPCLPVAVQVQSHIVRANLWWRLTHTTSLSFGEHLHYILSSIADEAGRCRLHSSFCPRHLKLGGLQEYDMQYLHALLEDDWNTINLYEIAAKMSGYGPHLPCDYVASPSTQSQLCRKYFLLSCYSHILTLL